MRRLFVLFMVFAAVCIGLSSCSSVTDPGGGGGGGSDAVPRTTITGQLEVVTNSTLKAEHLRVLTFAGSADVAIDGTFTVEVVDSDTWQWLLFVSKTTGNVAYIGLYDPWARSVMADDTSTALALTMSVPHLIFTDHSDREQYLDTVESSMAFTDLVDDLWTAWEEDAETALDYDTNAVIFQQIADLSKWAMEYLGAARGGRLAPPHLEDAPGDNVNFVNPRQIWYAAWVQDETWTPIDVVTVERDATPTYAWGWPPTVTPTSEETSYALGDGSYYICMIKGDDFSAIENWSDPVGRATALNTGQAAIHIIELMTGYRCTPTWTSLASYLDIPALYANQLALDLRQEAPERFVVHFCEFLSDNSDDWADWCWEGDTPSSAPEDFLEAAGWIWRDVNFAVDLLSYVNDEGPFFWDWALADEDLCYSVTQEAGVITSLDDFLAPSAAFTVDPPAGVVGTQFTFDASTTTDDSDPIGDLTFRWDWSSDGTWDTSWEGNQTKAHSYTQSGSYTVTMQAKDTDGLIGTVTHNVNVGGGAGTANHVKLFRDLLPWYSNATVEVLEALGFTPGTGPDTYEILSSSQMATADLIPGQDLVIICNDQAQSFYDSYAGSQIRFNSFIYSGGSLLWEACDEGWNYGSMAQAGIILPGDVHPLFDYDWLNFVTDGALPLVAGLPETLDHNYASHESFTNLPDGTTVYCRDESWNPTLVEYSLGAGWVVLSGQPLEHQYDTIYGQQDMDELLPRIVSHFTGQTVPKKLRDKQPPLTAQNPSFPQ